MLICLAGIVHVHLNVYTYYFLFFFRSIWQSGEVRRWLCPNLPPWITWMIFVMEYPC